MQDAIANKRFREDLFYRLNALTITVPPLRERREEIPLLMEKMVERAAIELGQPFSFSPRIVEAAQDYHWPGNLRELRNFVTRTLILRDQESAYNDLRAKTKSNATVVVDTPSTEAAAGKTGTGAPGMRDIINDVKNQTEIRILQEALSASGWNRRRAASNLNISYRSLLYKIEQHGLTA
jgi:DNA-binding NtrC family response regulator